MDGLNYHHLLYFWTVARTGSIAKASLELGLTQPTISEQLRVLEQSLGHKLFERAGRSLVLTEKGSTVLRYAERIFALGKELTTAVLQAAAPASQKLRIAVAPDVSATMIAEAFRPLAKLKPAPPLSVLSLSPQQAMAMLANRKIDLVLSGAADLRKGYPGAHRHLLLDCGISFFARNGSGRFPKSLHDQAILMPAELVRTQLQRWLKANRLATHTAGEVESPELAVMLAESGLGVAVLPDLAAGRALKLKLLGRSDAVRWRVYAYTSEKHPRSPALAALLGLQTRAGK
jgi:LysR family transcriptional regulator, transcriptional activator of nhaA